MNGGLTTGYRDRLEHGANQGRSRGRIKERLRDQARRNGRVGTSTL